MKLSNIVKRIFKTYNYDREAERLIYKSIELYQRGGKLNYWRSVRMYNYIRRDFNCNIWPGIQIGSGTYIAHAHGVLIGKTAVIGNNCKFFPNSYIVASVKGDDERWEQQKRRHAKVGNDCIFGNSCIVVGPIVIGDDVTIGAGAVVTKDVPSHMVVKGINEFRLKRLEEIPDKYWEDFKGGTLYEEI